jgi:hypothetical protein
MGDYIPPSSAWTGRKRLNGVTGNLQRIYAGLLANGKVAKVEKQAYQTKTSAKSSSRRTATGPSRLLLYITEDGEFSAQTLGGRR